MGQLCSTPRLEEGHEHFAEASVPGAFPSAAGSSKLLASRKPTSMARLPSDSSQTGRVLSCFLLKNKSRSQTTSVEGSVASLQQRTPTGMPHQRTPSGQRENLQLDNGRLRSKIMALERLADQGERAQYRLEQRCEKLAQDNVKCSFSPMSRCLCHAAPGLPTAELALYMHMLHGSWAACFQDLELHHSGNTGMHNELHVSIRKTPYVAISAHLCCSF